MTNQQMEAYLSRINYTGSRELTGETLDALIRAHIMSVPFENLTCCEFQEVPSLDPEDLYVKVVENRRGGYCFELNGLFGALLRGLGFAVQPCMARVLTRPNPYPLITHRANIVSFGDERYLADVGFGGPMPTFAPLIQDGATRAQFGHTFTLHATDGLWWNVGYIGSKEEERIVMCFCEMPVEEHDFIPLSFFQARNPESAFRTNRMVNIKTEEGAYDIRNNTFTVFAGAEKTVVEIEGDEALDQLLAEKFGIVDWR